MRIEPEETQQLASIRPSAKESVRRDDWVYKAAAANLVLCRPKENKRLITIRLDSDVLDHFRAQGRGWQGRINAVLRSFVESYK